MRTGSETGAAKEAYVWHPYYIDALAVRFWDNNSDGDYLDTNETHFSLHDGNFNVTALIDTTGAVFERFTYSPYGKLIVLDANFALDADGASDVNHSYTYTGRQLDSESGVYYYRYRYYHGQLGRFVGRDLSQYIDGMSLYQAYFALKGVDPLGLAMCQCVVHIIPLPEEISAIGLFNPNWGLQLTSNPGAIRSEPLVDVRCHKQQRKLVQFDCLDARCGAAKRRVYQKWVTSHCFGDVTMRSEDNAQSVGAAAPVPAFLPNSSMWFTIFNQLTNFLNVNSVIDGFASKTEKAKADSYCRGGKGSPVAWGAPFTLDDSFEMVTLPGQLRSYTCEFAKQWTGANDIVFHEK